MEYLDRFGLIWTSQDQLGPVRPSFNQLLPTLTCQDEIGSFRTHYDRWYTFELIGQICTNQDPYTSIRTYLDQPAIL